MPPATFKNKVIAIAGPPPEPLTTTQLKRWTELRKGIFSNDFDQDVTHLLCTKEQFREPVPRVKEGLRRKNLKIVDFDWLELSSVLRKTEKVAKYCWRLRSKKKRALRRKRERLARVQLLAERFVNTSLYRVYYDLYSFRYEVELTRENHLESGHAERYILYLFESVAKPPLFWFATKYFRRKGDSQPAYWRPSECPGVFEAEFREFKRFFCSKTGLEWEDRVVFYGTMPSPYFTYAPPVRGKPVGQNTLFSADMSRELNVALRGLPLSPPEEQKVKEVVLETEIAETDDSPLHGNDCFDWSSLHADNVSHADSCDFDLRLDSEDEDEDGLEMLGESPNTVFSFNENIG